jgi:hypothetical protein
VPLGLEPGLLQQQAAPAVLEQHHVAQRHATSRDSAFVVLIQAPAPVFDVAVDFKPGIGDAPGNRCSCTCTAGRASTAAAVHARSNQDAHIYCIG